MSKDDFTILVDEAIMHARLNKKTIHGEKITKQSLAKELWETDKIKNSNANIYNFSKGKTGKKFVEIIRKICKITGVDANFLLQTKPMNNENSQV